MNKQKLASKIWKSANNMRSKIDASEYKDYILGFMFYKFLSDKEVSFLKSKDYTDDDIKTVSDKDIETVDYIRRNLGYFISYDNLFSTWIKKGIDFGAGDVKTALSAFERMIDDAHKNVFDNIFNTLQSGLNKLGATDAKQTKSISKLISLLNLIPMNGRENYDVLGFIYEYLISNFAANAGKKAGEFYTPHEVSLLMSEIVAEHLKDRKEIKIYDPTSGSGSLLINIGECVAKHNKTKDDIKYYAQELKENTYNLTRMNLIMRGILPDNIVVRLGDTLEDDWPYFEEDNPQETYDPLYVDAVVSNPPYSQKWNPDGKESDPRYSDYGLAPKSKADYAFLLHDLFHLKPNGIMNIVLPHGVLFRNNGEREIRKNLIEKNHIDTIIGLPANIFYGTGIPTIIMVLKKDSKKTNDILIIDASKGFEKVGNKNQLRQCDIKKIVDTVVQRKEIEKFSSVVTLEEIRKNDYNLNIPRYVDSSEESEKWDLYSLMYGGIPKYEVDKLNEYWEAFPVIKDKIFDRINEEYYKVKSDNVRELIDSDPDIQKYKSEYKSDFKKLELFLKNILFDNFAEINIPNLEVIINNEILHKMEHYPLIDKYQAYQIFQNFWAQISVDLEIIRNEGFKSVKIVDPKMVIKKKKNIEEEVQDGWVGRILPFDIVQKSLLFDDLEEIKGIENRKSEILADYQEIVDSFDQEEKEIVTKEDGSIDKKRIPSLLKESDDDLNDSETFGGKLKKYSLLLKEEKALNKKLKLLNSDLLKNTKSTIENLTDEEASGLLVEKWISPLIKSLIKLSDIVVSNIVDKINYLSKKYEVTLSNLDEEIKTNEHELSSLIDELEGNEYDMKALSELKSLLGGD